jgi:hypothetical protein
MTHTLDEKYIDGNIPEPYQWVQATLDRFVEINYDAALDAVRLHVKELDAGHIRQQMVDIIRNNPPLKTVPVYFRDGRENYLWYSDFYDDAGKDVFGKQYRKFIPPEETITPSNYAIELAKIDLPYFRELVDLISLVKLEQEAERIESKKAVVAPVPEPAEPERVEPVDGVKPVEAPAQPQPTHKPEAKPAKEKPASKRITVKRSYLPKLSSEQCSLLTECVNEINLFRRPMQVSELKKLLNGKLTEPLQVTNQKSLTYIFEKLRENKLIKQTWISVAVGNEDFLSFRRGKNIDRYGDGPHYVSMQQFLNNRKKSVREAIIGFDAIEDAMDQILDAGDK